MKLLSIVFLVSLLFGQVGGFSIAPGIVIYSHDLMLMLLLIAGILRYSKNKFIKPKLIVPIFLFAGASVISLLANASGLSVEKLGLSSLYLVRWTLYAFVYGLVLQQYMKPGDWLKGLFAVGVGFGLLGIIQFFLYPDLRNLLYLGWDPHYYRVFSTLLDPNFVGLLFVFTILLGLHLLKNKQWKFYIIPGEFVSIVSLLFTYSRSSFLSLSGALLFLAVFEKKLKILLSIAVLIIVIYFLPIPFGKTLSIFRTDSTFARIGNWQESIALILQAPVFGHGFDTLRFVTPADGPYLSKSASGVDSSLLFVGVTTGVVGLIAYAYLVFFMIRMGLRLLRYRKTVVLGEVYIASLTALGIHSLFVNSAFYPWVMIWMWVLTGVAEVNVTGDT